MKNFIIAALVTIFITGSSFAANATINNDSQDLSDFQKISQLIDGQKTQFFYTSGGELIATSKALAYDKLPKAALTYLANNYAYPIYSLEDCMVVNYTQNDTDYFVSFNKGKEKVFLQIDVRGNVIELVRKG